MRIRTLALAGALAVTLLVAGCATSIAGQAQVDPGAVATASAPSSDESSGSAEESTSPESGADQTVSEPSTPESTEDQGPTEQTSASPTSDGTSDSSTSTSEQSVVPTSIPGLSADCNKVLAAITAFSSVLQGADAGDMNAKITQATVDAALQQLPASGLPARPQADVNVLRTTVSGAAGKTIAELGLTMTDGKVVAALQDLSSWATSTCA